MNEGTSVPEELAPFKRKIFFSNNNNNDNNDNNNNNVKVTQSVLENEFDNEYGTMAMGMGPGRSFADFEEYEQVSAFSSHNHKQK